MSLKAKMAAKRALKEQKFADRQFKKVAQTGEALSAEIAANSGKLDLNVLEDVAREFGDASGNSQLMDALMSKPKNRIMYEAVKEHLEGDWMADFRKLLAEVPISRRSHAQNLTWEEWRGYGDAAGLDEKQMVQALQVIVIFRKSAAKMSQRQKGI